MMEKRLRILHITKYLPEFAGGIENVTKEMALVGAEIGADVRQQNAKRAAVGLAAPVVAMIAGAAQGEQDGSDVAFLKRVRDRERHDAARRDQTDRRRNLQSLPGHGLGDPIIEAGRRRRPEGTARDACRHR